MIADTHRGEPPIMGPQRFFTDLQVAARYVIAKGTPFFAAGHIDFMRSYLEVWKEQKSDDKEVAEANADLEALEAEARHKLYPLLVLLWGILLSIGSSAWLVLGKSIRIVPPLITAVVVVFITSDAWRILGTGFTPRIISLVTLFLIASLLVLIRFKGYWEEDWDIDSSDKDTLAALLKHIQSEMGDEHGVDRRTYGAAKDEPHQQRDSVDVSPWQQFHELMHFGAKPVPLVKPAKLRARVCLYSGYVAVSAFSLIVVAMAVSASLIFVGLILISAKETNDLAQSVHIYLRLPWHLVITRQLVSLSVCLGAFAAFFLVAAQRPTDRKDFMDNVLAHVRRAFVVYSVYCHAHDSAAGWTDVPVNPPKLVWETRRSGRRVPGPQPRS